MANLILGDGSPIYSAVIEISTNALATIGVTSNGGSTIENSQDIKNPDGSPKYQAIFSTDKQQLLDYLSTHNVSDPDDLLTSFNA